MGSKPTRRSAAAKGAKPKAPAKAKPARKNPQQGSSAVGERRAHTPDVAGSTPAPATKHSTPDAHGTAHSAAVLAHLADLKPGPRRFAIEYLKDHNATQAYIRAGYTANPASADANARRLLGNARISAAIAAAEAEMLGQVQRETGITLERTLREIARGAFHDPRRFFDEKGNLRPITELDDDTAAALAGFEVTEEFQGRGEARESVGFTKKIKLGDRKGYLDMLMKHLGGYESDNKQKNVDLAEALRGFFGQLHGTRLPIAKPERKAAAVPSGGNPLVKG